MVGPVRGGAGGVGLLGRLLRDVARAAFPLGCTSCGGLLSADADGEDAGDGAGSPLCTACTAGLVDCGEPFCLTCASKGGAPRRCRDPGHFRLHAAFVWNEPLKAIVHAFKFDDAPELAERLALWAWDTPAFLHHPRPDLLVPVPLHAVRRRERGFDQAALLSGALGVRAGVANATVLARVRSTRQQARLPARSRRVNVEGAFRVLRPELVRGRRVALVDDVVTTGATIGSAAQVLRAAGAQSVTGWCLAYEPLEGDA